MNYCLYYDNSKLHMTTDKITEMGLSRISPPMSARLCNTGSCTTASHRVRVFGQIVMQSCIVSVHLRLYTITGWKILPYKLTDDQLVLKITWLCLCNRSTAARCLLLTTAAAERPVYTHRSTNHFHFIPDIKQ